MKTKQDLKRAITDLSDALEIVKVERNTLQSHIKNIATAFDRFAETDRPLQCRFDQLRNVIDVALSKRTKIPEPPK